MPEGEGKGWCQPAPGSWADDGLTCHPHCPLPRLLPPLASFHAAIHYTPYFVWSRSQTASIAHRFSSALCARKANCLIPAFGARHSRSHLAHFIFQRSVTKVLLYKGSLALSIALPITGNRCIDLDTTRSSRHQRPNHLPGLLGQCAISVHLFVQNPSYGASGLPDAVW